MTRATYPPEHIVDERKRFELPWRYSPSISRASAIGLVVASTATLAAIIAVLVNSTATNPSSGSRSVPPTADPSAHIHARAPAAAPPQASAPGPSDDRGFINSYARCDGSPPATAIGRTAKSLVVICHARNGGYVYKGIRLSQGTGVTIGTVTADAAGFVARGEGVNYAVTSTALVITSGDRLLAREPMLEYRTPPTQAETPPAVTPAPGYPALPATAQGKPPGTP